jgi:AAA15 family ATPase/GTPase
MILRIFIKNFLSFYEETSASFFPGTGTSTKHVIRSEKRDDIPALKAAVLYGANASGKSNFIHAISFFKYFVTHGFAPQRGIEYESFKLSGKKKKLSKIEFEIKIKDKNYAYGAEFNQTEIKEEWLYVINKRTEQEIFTRRNTPSKVEVNFGKVKFSDKETENFAKFTGRGTARNKLFLQEAIHRNIDFIAEINSVYNYFKHQLKIISPESRYSGIDFHLKEDKNLTQTFSKFLKYFKTGVEELIRKEIALEEIKDLPQGVLDNIKSNLKANGRSLINSIGNRNNYAFEMDKHNNLRAFQLATTHKSFSGEDIHFSLQEESDGTNRIIDFIPSLIDLTSNDVVYIIDEIDRSMHPILTRGIIEFYLANSENTKSQLIVSTHESSLLDLELLRSDEIWFVEKEKNGNSKMYSLLEFKPRPVTKIRKGYLQGRYGAIPFLSNPNDLNW